MSVDFPSVLIAGGGIGGLATALALSKVGCFVNVLEQAHHLGEGGAGLQLGPNAYSILKKLGVNDTDDLTHLAGFPNSVRARDAKSNQILGELALGGRSIQKYGHEYATMHRADLHASLLKAVYKRPLLNVHNNAKVETVKVVGEQIRVTIEREDTPFEGDILIGCDGLWSFTRKHMLGDVPPVPTGYVAWRALLPMKFVPEDLRENSVNVWMGPEVHVLGYAVKRGAFFNLVVVIQDDEAATAPKPQSWSRDANGLSPLDFIQKASSPAYSLNSSLSKLLRNVTEKDGGGWTRWTLFDRDPISSASEMAHPDHPRLALVGDACHPMRPFLGQGAAMAIEDAYILALAVQQNRQDLPKALQVYAQHRWERVAKVQMRSRRAGRIYHMQGIERLARNLAMRLMGEKLMDLPWLYAGQPRLPKVQCAAS